MQNHFANNNARLELLNVVGAGSIDLTNMNLVVNDGSVILRGTSADDLILGGYNTTNGNGNTISGNGGNDTIYAGAGSNSINAGSGDDTIYGRSDDDTLYGESGFDLLFGENGNDTLYGSEGSDRLNGGSGNDTFIFEDIDDYTGDLYNIVEDLNPK